MNTMDRQSLLHRCDEAAHASLIRFLTGSTLFHMQDAAHDFPLAGWLGPLHPTAAPTCALGPQRPHHTPPPPPHTHFPSGRCAFGETQGLCALLPPFRLPSCHAPATLVLLPRPLALLPPPCPLHCHLPAALLPSLCCTLRLPLVSDNCTRTRQSQPQQINQSRQEAPRCAFDLVDMPSRMLVWGSIVAITSQLQSPQLLSHMVSCHKKELPAVDRQLPN